MGGERVPLALFALACAALTASAVLLAGEGEQPAAPRPATRVIPGASRALDDGSRAALGHRTAASRAAAAEDLAPGERPDPSRLAERAALLSAARRFLAAFWRYEVGDLSPPVRAGLRATASRAFVAELLRAPPRPLAGSRLPRARLAGIEPTFLPGTVPRAVVGGTLRRGAQLEPFAFEFERAGALWLAVGVAE